MTGAELSSDERLDRLWSTEQIRQLVACYAHHRDCRDIDGLIALFAGDVRAQFERALRDGVAVVDLGLGGAVVSRRDSCHHQLHALVHLGPGLLGDGPDRALHGGDLGPGRCVTALAAGGDMVTGTPTALTAPKSEKDAAQARALGP